MNVSDEQFSNLDNFKRTSLTGPDATRKLERPSAATAREARRLRRAGVMRGYEALMIDASKQRLGEGGMKSYETKQSEEEAVARETARQNAIKKRMIDQLEAPAVTEPPAMLRRPDAPESSNFFKTVDLGGGDKARILTKEGFLAKANKERVASGKLPIGVGGNLAPVMGSETNDGGFFTEDTGATDTAKTSAPNTPLKSPSGTGKQLVDQFATARKKARPFDLSGIRKSMNPTR